MEDSGGHRKRGFEDDDRLSPTARQDSHGELRSPKKPRDHRSSSPKKPRDQRSPRRSRDFHGDNHRGRAFHGDDRSPRRRDDSRGEDEFLSRRRDSHGSHRSPRRRDLQGEDESPTRTRHFYDGALSPRARNNGDAFSRRRQNEKHSTFERRSHNDRDGRYSFEEHDQRGTYMNTDEDAGSARFANRQRRSEHGEGELPKLYSVHRAKVQSVRPFGLFVRLEGFYKQGLVHVSQLSSNEVTNRDDPDEVKVQAIAAVAEEGDRVWVKVISLKEEEGNVKIGCSLKFVSQSSGEDLDPNNVKLEQQQQFRGNRQEPRKMTLDAIYNVMCTRCGGHGHLKTECYSIDKKPYELLPDIDNQVKEEPRPPTQDYNLLREAAGVPGLGRGRAMVLPAWMTQGIGANLGEAPASGPRKEVLDLPDKVTTVEEALAVIAQVKKDKKDRRKRHKHRKDGTRNSSKEERKKRKERGEKSGKHREGKHRSAEGVKRASKDERKKRKERG